MTINSTRIIPLTTGDTSGSVTFYLVSYEDPTEPMDLTGKTARLAVNFRYEGQEDAVREIALVPGVPPTAGVVYLTWPQHELVGVIPGQYEGAIRVYTGSSRYTVATTVRFRVDAGITV